MVDDQTQRHTHTFRSLFLSDLHLGAPGSKSQDVLEFLHRHDAQTIFMVGDVFDLWDPLVVHWGAAEQTILALLQERAAKGSKIVWLVGNHDRALLSGKGQGWRDHIGLPDLVLQDVIHTSGDGRRYLVLHGDICDARLLRFHIWTRIGSRIDSLLRLCDRGLRRLRSQVTADARGPLEIAISAMNALLYRGLRHERRLIALARSAGCDGVICGHFHIAALHDDHGLRYANCGDWTDNCTALVEEWDGALVLVRHACDVPDHACTPQTEGA